VRQFRDIFPAELNAVEARRRRYRMEQLLGQLPKAPELLPDRAALDRHFQDTEAALAPPLGAPQELQQLHQQLQQLRQATEEARQALQRARRNSLQPTKSKAPATQALTEEFSRRALEWHQQAKHYRNQRFRAYLEQGGNTRAAWEEAEAITTAAAKAFADAAAEFHQERAIPAPAAAAAARQPLAPSEVLSVAFGVVLACEREVHASLEALMEAISPEVFKAEEHLGKCLWRLARAEQELFEEAAAVLASPERQAACRDAASAVGVEVQKALRFWNKAKSRTQPPPHAPPAAPGGPGGPPGGGVPPLAPDPDVPEARSLALDRDLVGLALSGGGIRAATFGLGVLQGLSQLRLLGMFDFLSTVSGGGYIGSWLAAWIHREGSLANVERQLSPNRISESLATRFDPNSGAPLNNEPSDEEPEPVHHLRQYSRYLSPRFGPASPDTWTLFTIYLRNLFVNALFLLPLAVALVFLWRLLLQGYSAKIGPDVNNLALSEWLTSGRFWLTLLFFTACLFAIWRVSWEEENLFEADIIPFRRRTVGDLKWLHFGLLLPLLIVGVVGPWIFSLDPHDSTNQSRSYEYADRLRYFGQARLPEPVKHVDVWVQFAFGFAFLALVPSLLVRILRWGKRRRLLGSQARFNWRGFVASLFLTLFFGLFLYLVLYWVIWPCSYYGSPLTAVAKARPGYLCLLHAVGLPLVFAAIVLGGFAEMAVVGRWIPEYEREWRARIAAYLLMGATAWLLVAVSVLLLPWAMDVLFQVLHDLQWATGPTTLSGIITAAWAAVSASGAWLAGRAAATDRAHPPRWWVRALLMVAPPVFLIGLLAGVSAFGQLLVDWRLDDKPVSDNFLQRVVSEETLTGSVPLLVLAVVLLFAFGGLISVNRFSLHMLYANRLTRCYLGASRPKHVGSLGTPTGVPPGPPSQPTGEPIREPNRFTGFDPLDDFPLSELRTVNNPIPYVGPLPLVNCALNCLAGDELAYQDRRADAFVMTPEQCGGRLTGYAATPSGKRDARNLTLGRVMTISGAAVDPNMNGLSPPLTALMTIFNTRLGWWLENPNPSRRAHFRGTRAPWGASEPGFGWQILWEVLGWTNEDYAYVHISDGGHFENLGVYELIRRRCRFIVVVDAGTDRTAASDNMAAMLRLIRTDFGVRIELDPARMQLEGARDYSPWHCGVGRIRYDEVDEDAVPGLMVYLQATLSGDEPADLLQYASRYPTFPRQSTLNQFFDESQFEAYRMLGHHIATQVFSEASSLWTGTVLNGGQHQHEVRSVFARLREQWFPPLPCTSAEWLAASQSVLQLEQHMARDGELLEFGHTLYPEVLVVAPPPGSPPVRHLQEFRAVSQTLQVMEMAWSAMQLNSLHAHPLNRGWMNTFRRWTAAPAFQRFWPILRSEYSRPFVNFCEDVLNLQPLVAVADRLVPVAVPPGPVEQQINQLDLQFGQQWADTFHQLNLSTTGLVPLSFLSGLRGQALSSSTGQPFAWLIHQEAVNQPHLICGFVCVARSALQTLIEPNAPPDEAELFLWMLGAYRSMGLGRQAGQEILWQIQNQGAFLLPGVGGAAPQALRRLTVYYPLRGTTSGGRLELERWMDFFFDLGFRRIRQPTWGVGSQFVILKCWL